MNRLKLWQKLSIAFVLLWVCLHPLTRPVVVWLLIPGTGFDDIFVALVLVYVFIQFWKYLGEKRKA